MIDTRHVPIENHGGFAGAELLIDDRQGLGENRSCVAAIDESLTDVCQESHEAQCSSTDVGQGWLELRTFAEMYHDQQVARISANNRALRGSVDPGVYTDTLHNLEIAEHEIEKAMWRCYRRVVPPELVAWQRAERGIGEHLFARLLGHLGDPYIATPAWWTTNPPDGHICDPLRCGDGKKRHLVAGRPYIRTISQLWSYCGYGDPKRRPVKGMTADEAMRLGNPTNKMLLHLLAEATMKQKANPGRYRLIYDNARERYADRTHADDCRRCGPSGKPALAGSSWSLAHQHAAALRLVCKEMLRDMWLIRHQTVHG